MNFYYILFFLLGHSALGTSPIALKFSEFPIEFPDESHAIHSMNGKHVQISGFWYPISADEGILASTPSLKSCCIKAIPKISQQVVVKGNIPNDRAQIAVKLEGIFKIEPIYNQKGELIQLYVLNQARESQKLANNGWLLIFVCLAIPAVLYLFFTHKQG